MNSVIVERRPFTMPEILSRALFAAEMVLIGLPTAVFFVVPFVVPAAFLLTPVAFFGLLGTLFEGGPQMAHELWVGAGVLLMAVLAICTIVALLCLLALGSAFVFLGRAKLSRQSALLRWGILFGAPPVLLSSIPQLFAELQTFSFSFNRLLLRCCIAASPLSGRLFIWRGRSASAADHPWISSSLIRGWALLRPQTSRFREAAQGLE